MIPLQDPAAGWSANYGVWIRSFIVTAMFANGVIVQAKYMTSGCVISLRQQLCLVLCTTALETVLAMIVAANVWFPIPFAILTMTPTFYPVLIALFYAIVGLPVIREILNHSDTLQQYKKYSRAQQVMAIIYPAYQVLFHAARRTKYELPVTFLLPVIKLFLKTNVQRHLSHMEDIMPEAVIFSVDLFNALQSVFYVVFTAALPPF
ncbi:hypothetical protein PHYBOEH_011461 [Phytophthora boehmeriae]|uniref:Uncharacterized protein n=1 Tax=Phytophthora boehmeriae TaxID=109152 RepID=A0A8T1WXR0_9STRA|nr:hypothetical protein PHYBOEH_011461 [Phytophthora boehmeriae]